MRFLTGSPGRKIVMAVTGFSMIAFITFHLLGNTLLYVGPDAINAYARTLQHFGPFIWSLRLVMLVMISLHVFFGIQLTLENRAARPQAYAVKKNIASTFASRTMIWTGLLISGFIVFHLLHFTLQVIDPELSARRHMDALGRPDVFMMVVTSFRKYGFSAIYILSLSALGLHLMHSIQSAFQTVGLNSEKALPVIMKAGAIAALLFFLGYSAFPASVITGFLR